MPIAGTLTQEQKLDALLPGGGNGDWETTGTVIDSDGEGQRYAFAEQNRIVRGRMSALEGSV